MLFCSERCLRENRTHGLLCGLLANLSHDLYGRLGETGNVLELVAYFGLRKLLEMNEYCDRTNDLEGNLSDDIRLDCSKFFEENGKCITGHTFNSSDLSEFVLVCLSPTYVSDRHAQNMRLKAIHAVYIVSLLEEVNFFKNVNVEYYSTCKNIFGGIVLELMFRLEYSRTPLVYDDIEYASGYYPAFNRITHSCKSNAYYAYYKRRLYVFAREDLNKGTILTKKHCEMGRNKYDVLSRGARAFFDDSVANGKCLLCVDSDGVRER